MYENEIRNRFIKELEKIGFPIESIVLEYEVKRKSLEGWIDIAVVDSITNKILMIFEVKALSEKQMLKQKLEKAKSQLKKYMDILQDAQIPAYVILATDKDKYEIYKYNKDIDENGEDLIEISINDIVPYVVLCAGSRTSEKKEVSTNIKKETDKFKCCCWVLAVCSLIIAFMDILHVVSISNTQLVLYGAAVALIIIPFSNKLKILGVEFERLSDEKKDTKTD